MVCLGNDLARVLRWGSGYSGAEDLMSLLHDVIDAEDIQLDRYRGTFIFSPVSNCNRNSSKLMQVKVGPCTAVSQLCRCEFVVHVMRPISTFTQ